MTIFGMSVNVPGDDKLKYINFGHTVAIEITCYSFNKNLFEYIWQVSTNLIQNIHQNKL